MSNTATPTAPGRLVLVPAPLDFGCAEQAALDEALPLGTLRIAAGIAHWICENAKSTRAYLKRIDAVVPLAQPLQQLVLTELPRAVHKKGDHTGGFDARALLGAALQGHDVGLVSEAGMPAVADPGSSVVRAAHALGLAVLPLVGPSALLLALAASGLNGQNFAFVGYLPQEAQARAERIRQLEALARRTDQAQICIETPYRSAALCRALLEQLQPDTRLAIACGLTLPGAQIISRSVQAWRRQPAPLPDTPAVFAFGP